MQPAFVGVTGHTEWADPHQQALVPWQDRRGLPSLAEILT